jgi:hypothetical protein
MCVIATHFAVDKMRKLLADRDRQTRADATAALPDILGATEGEVESVYHWLVARMPAAHRETLRRLLGERDALGSELGAESSRARKCSARTFRWRVAALYDWCESELALERRR